MFLPLFGGLQGPIRAAVNVSHRDDGRGFLLGNMLEHNAKLPKEPAYPFLMVPQETLY